MHLTSQGERESRQYFCVTFLLNELLALRCAAHRFSASQPYPPSHRTPSGGPAAAAFESLFEIPFERSYLGLHSKALRTHGRRDESPTAAVISSLWFLPATRRFPLRSQDGTPCSIDRTLSSEALRIARDVHCIVRELSSSDSYGVA